MPPGPSSSAAATLLATSLIVAEFDIDTGACLRACYPRATSAALSNPTPPSTHPTGSVEAAAPPGIAGHTEYFANVMLPDGAEKVSVTRTVFVVNRPQPPVFLRFPVYRFAREGGDAARSPHASPPPPVTSGAGADAATRWSRAPGEESSLYVPEMLLINTTNRAVSLKYKDTEIEAPTVIPIENLSSLPSLPPDVVRFSKQLEAMLMNEATLAGSRTSSFAAAGDISIGDSGGATGGGGVGSGPCVAAASSSSSGGGMNAAASSSDYAFVVITYADDHQEGYLMRIAHFERLLKEMMMMESAERSAGAAAAEAAAAEAAAAPPTSPPPPQFSAAGDASVAAAAGDSQHDEGGPLGAPNASRSAEACAPVMLSGSLHGPRSGSAGTSTPTSGFVSAGGGVQLPDSATPPCPATRVDADAYTPAASGVHATSPTTSPESAGHLFLPRVDSMSSGSYVADSSVADAALGGRAATPSTQCFVDPAAAATGSRSAAEMSSKRQSVQCGVDEAGGSPVLFGLCAVVSKRDSTARRGGITKSVAVLGPSLVWLEPFFPMLVAAAQYCCNVSGTTDEAIKELQRILKRCYDSINNAASVVAAGRAKVDKLTAEVGKYCTLGSGQQAYVYYNDAPFGSPIKAKIPLSPESNDIAFTKYSIETLIEVLGPSFVLLILGILTEKKILILSRKGEASDVCEVALSLGIIGNLLDRSFMAKKVFPYVSVSSVDHFLHVPGYIVGTLNPIFENVQPWGWDLLCDLDNRLVMTAAERMQRRQITPAASAGGGGSNWATATAGLANAVGVGSGGAEAEALRGLPAPLQQLYKKLVTGMYHLRALRVSAVERNRRLRLVLEDFLYTVVMVGYVAGGTVSVPNALYPVFAHRSLGVLRLEMMLTSMLDNVSTQVLHPKESPALLLNCAALRQCASGETPVQRTLLTLLGLLETAYDVKLFLRRMTLAVGGLNAVGMQLTHPSPDARVAAAALLARVESVPEGKAAVASLNNFFLMVYENGSRGARQ
jgi:hypothetical protein